MQQWEYQSAELVDLSPQSRQLADLGNDGWEFVYGQMMTKQGTIEQPGGGKPAPVSIIFALFKRPKVEVDLGNRSFGDKR